MSTYQSYVVILFKSLIILVLIFMWALGLSALVISGPDPAWLRYCIAALFGLSLPGVYYFSNSFIKGSLGGLFIWGILLFWWINLSPSNNRDWLADVAEISHGEIVDDTLTVYNVRNFRYRSTSDFDVRWETREYDLNKLQGLDLFLSYWASDHIAHTILSWDFGDNNHLAISIETRKETGEQYSAIKGFFRQYELSYIAASEDDLIKLRTNFRKERVYLYRLQADIDRVKELLFAYLEEMNRLVNEPRFYDAFHRNCTTTIRLHTNTIQPDDPLPLDYRLVLSGHVDELLYERGAIANHLSFEKTRLRSRIDQRMQTFIGDNYSAGMRSEPH